MKRPQQILLTILEYLLGFIALTVFAAIALTGSPSDEKFVWAFKVAGGIAFVELCALFYRAKPANRLIVGANLWLIAAGTAALFEQWWWLRGLQRLGESSLFLSILAVGLVSTFATKAGFVGVLGERKSVLRSSVLLLAAALIALFFSIYFRGDVKFAGVLPIIALSWVHRLIKLRV